MCGVATVDGAPARAASPAASRKNGASALHAQIAERVGEHAARWSAGSRARSRRRTAPACGCRRTRHSPSAPRAEIERERDAGRRRRRGDAVAGAQKPGMAEDQRRRHQPVASRVAAGRRCRRRWLRAAARAAAGRPRALPFGRGTIMRQDVEAPRPRQAVGGRVDVVGDAVLVQSAGRRASAPARVLGAECAGASANADQCGRSAPSPVAHLVEVARRGTSSRRSSSRSNPAHGSQVRRSSV